ncbi:YgzB family protein [Planococcus maitriensis]|uniref:Uncharacterized protein n=1 Tax=Planococcus maitriensis TaxID=221799 RepID=A0A365K041_9BACL|nr:YgzB family protein [Planococcus maitriensis]RAZ65996.1 hypothetical protein DP119_14515 [Planococcus maitriensis]
MKSYKNKINRIRTFALALIFIGIVIMYAGIFFRSQPLVMVIFMLLGLVAIIGSTGVYAWIGLLSMKTVPVQCPNCERHTKMLGRVDICMHCNEPLTMDPSLEGKEFNEEYNKKKPQL